MKRLDFSPFSIMVRGQLVTFARPAVMGILNITPDSFYDGGRYRDAVTMLAQARKLLADGADILDVGAASSRPGAELPPPEVEAQRLDEAVRLIRSELPEAIISVDTCEPMLQYVGMDMVDLLIGQDYPRMGSLGVELLYKLIKGEEVDLGDETHYIDTGYELVDKSNYEEVWATKTPW